MVDLLVGKPAKKVNKVLLFHASHDINLMPKHSENPWEVITTCVSGIKGFWFAVTRYVHAALRGSNHASIWKHATAKRSGGHLDQLSAIGQYYESTY